MNVAPTAAPTWITVFHGPFPKALALQALLEAAGIRTWVPDETTKVMDPFLTGANPLAVELRVPAGAVGAARELLARSRGPAARPLTAADAAEAEARTRARLVRWCLVFGPFGWCVGCFAGLAYLRAARALPASPSGHVGTLALWLVQVLLVALFAGGGMFVLLTHHSGIA